MTLWLIDSSRVLGLNAQHWMLVIAGTFTVYFTVYLAYGVASLLIRRRRLLE